MVAAEEINAMVIGHVHPVPIQTLHGETSVTAVKVIVDLDFI